jgi:hypothetical protein
MARIDRPPRRRLVCFWCAEPVAPALAVVAEGFVWHQSCLDDREEDIGGQVCCIDCGYPAASRWFDRAESCRCHLAPLIYGDDAT